MKKKPAKTPGKIKPRANSSNGSKSNGASRAVSLPQQRTFEIPSRPTRFQPWQKPAQIT
jgi:hypothetical protein